VEFLGIWESVFNPAFNYGEFATIKSQAGLNSYKISVKEWVEKTNTSEIMPSNSGTTISPLASTRHQLLITRRSKNYQLLTKPRKSIGHLPRRNRPSKKPKK
jgi:hypothetical protein